MRAPRGKRLGMVFLLGAVALSVMLAFALKHSHAVLACYHASRLERAASHEEAAPHLEAIARLAGKPGASAALVGRLRSWPRFAFWLFTQLDAGELADSTLTECFARELERDEKLLAAWSHFVRWRLGSGLWSYLDGLGSVWTGAKGTIVLPRATSRKRGDVTACVWISDGRVLAGEGAIGWEAGPRNLRAYAILWFLGMSPLPPASGEKIEERLRDWLRPQTPLLRHIVEGSPVPENPLPGWEGPVPGGRAGGTVRVYDARTWQITPTITRTTAADRL